MRAADRGVYPAFPYSVPEFSPRCPPELERNVELVLPRARRRQLCNMNLSELAEPLGISRTRMKKHIGLLEQAELATHRLSNARKEIGDG